jgi:hypothetical protein
MPAVHRIYSTPLRCAESPCDVSLLQRSCGEKFERLGEWTLQNRGIIHVTGTVGSRLRRGRGRRGSRVAPGRPDET